MSICGGCPYPYEMMLAGNIKTEEEACGDGCLFEDAVYRTQLAYELLEKRYDKHIEEVKKLIPKEIWDETSTEFAESGNAGLWTMCLVAIEKLSDAYYELKEENKEYEQEYIAALMELAEKEIDPSWKEIMS